MLSDVVKEKLRVVFSHYEEVEAVYLFGSAASKKITKPHDIDLGIVASNSSLEKRKPELYADMVRQGLDRVDIVFFNSADLVLQFEIIHHNQLIYCKKSFKHAELFSKTIRKYFDIEPYLVRQQKAYKRRVLNDKN